METVLIDIYRKKSHHVQRSEIALDLLNNRLNQRTIPKKASANPVPCPSPNRRRTRGNYGKVSVGLHPPPDYFRKHRPSLDDRVQDFGNKVSEVPGFEELADKSNPRDIVCWSLILFALVVLTGYSFVHLILDYLDNPTVTSVKMQYSPQALFPQNAKLCVPFHVDRIPFSSKIEADTYFSWRDANELMESLLLDQDQTDHLPFKCPDRPKKEVFQEEQQNVTVRLINELGKRNNDYGRVELNVNGEWGTVCNTHWDKVDAQVVCRILGHSNSIKAITLHAIKSGPVPGRAWMRDVDCTGREKNIGYCTHSGWRVSTCGRDVANSAAVDCTGLANPEPWNGTTVENMAKYNEKDSDIPNFIDSSEDNNAFLRTAGALLARLSAIETSNLVTGETPVSMKWSTSSTHPAGLFYKEKAIENLLKLMEKHSANLTTLKKSLACGLCAAHSMKISLRRNVYADENDVDCSEAELLWLEDVKKAHKACFKLHLPIDSNHTSHTNVRKGTFLLAVDLSDFNRGVDWSNDTVREMYSDGFKLDLSGSINSEKETVETLPLSPGQQLTVTMDVAANYIADENSECSDDFGNCELRCMANLLQEACSHSCIPFSLSPLTFKQEIPRSTHYCLLEDYKLCLKNIRNSSGIKANCQKGCVQPCQHMTYSIRTLFRKPLPGRESEMRLHIKMDSEMYPEFQEESVITWYQLMGDLGGVIGLWLGASFVGVLHFIEFLLGDLIWARRLKKLKKQSVHTLPHM